MHGRHYIEIGKGPRPFIIKKTVEESVEALLVSGRPLATSRRYVAVSRHFTYAGALRRTRILNAREGHSTP